MQHRDELTKGLNMSKLAGGKGQSGPFGWGNNVNREAFWLYIQEKTSAPFNELNFDHHGGGDSALHPLVIMTLINSSLSAYLFLSVVFLLGRCTTDMN